MQLKQFFSKILIIIIVLWTILAGARMLFNLSKIFTEEKQWVFMSSQQKKEKLYGELQPISQMIVSKTTGSSQILLLSTDGNAYFLLRYLLYPQRVFWIENPSDLTVLPRSKSTYLFSFHDTRIPTYLTRRLHSTQIFAFDGNQISALYKIQWTQ